MLIVLELTQAVEVSHDNILGVIDSVEVDDTPIKFNFEGITALLILFLNFVDLST
jgi:hypothetical protein